MSDELEYTPAEPIHSTNVSYQQDRAMMLTQVDIAKKYPRNTTRAIQNITTYITLDVETAESCTYSLLKGGKAITGPSVVLAKMIVQEFGNIRVENKVIDVTDKHVICEATCFDLEKNIAMRTTVRKSIVGNKGRYSEDMIVITANALNSIALRNAVFSVIPKIVVDKLYKAAVKKITGDITEDQAFEARKITVFNGFMQKYADYGIQEIEICKAVGKNHINDVTRDDLIVLIGLEKSLQVGETNFDDAFRGNKKAPVPPAPEDKSEERLIKLINNTKDKASLKKLEKECRTNAERIAYDEKFKAL